MYDSSSKSSKLQEISFHLILGLMDCTPVVGRGFPTILVRMFLKEYNKQQLSRTWSIIIMLKLLTKTPTALGQWKEVFSSFTDRDWPDSFDTFRCNVNVLSSILKLKVWNTYCWNPDWFPDAFSCEKFEKVVFSSKEDTFLVVTRGEKYIFQTVCKMAHLFLMSSFARFVCNM